MAEERLNAAELLKQTNITVDEKSINIPKTEKKLPEVPIVKKDTTPIVYRTFPESMSDDIGKLAGALALAQGAMLNGTKDKQGYGYKYMTLDSLTDIARPALSANGISVLQSHELIKGAAPSVVTHTTVMHVSGQWHKSSLELPMQPMKQLSPAQMIGVVCSYGRRYSLQAICLVAAEDDTDGTTT